MKKEIWRPVPGFEGLYEASNQGRVKSLNYRGHGKEGILKQAKGKNGYLTVVLCNGKKQKTFLVHRIVAQAFIPNIGNKPQIDHINTIRNDNRAENLRWATPKENMCNPLTKEKSSDKTKEYFAKIENRNRVSVQMKKYYSKEENRKNASMASKKCWENPQYLKKQAIRREKLSKQVIQIDVETEKVIKCWPSIREAARVLGLDDGNIGKCCKGKKNSAGGFKWEYAEKGIA